MICEKKIYLWEYELVSLFPTKPVPSCEYLRRLYGNTLIDKSFRNMPIYMTQTLCKMKIFYVNDETYRFWANCVLENVDIYMLVIAVDGGPIWSIIKVKTAGGCFTNVSRALQDILSKFVYCRNRTSYENFKLKLCTCAQSHALGTRTKFQLEILTINVISGMVYFREIILESSRNVSKTTPCWTLGPR